MNIDSKILNINPFRNLQSWKYLDYIKEMINDRNPSFLSGRGAQINVKNRFAAQEFVTEHTEGIDEEFSLDRKTQFFEEYPKKIINKIESPDISSPFSMNPYQGCEHGCIYCYARNSHAYWGLSPGVDFESKILVKPEAPQLLQAELKKKSWKPATITLSGNTDCYQPAERKYKLTRAMLEVLLKYKNPVGIISKNQLILRDMDLLKQLAELNLVHVMISITSLQEDLRLKMEPRTATAKNRLKVVETLNANGIPAGVMVAPIVPGLNSHEIPDIIKAAADAGARGTGYTIVRLNGDIAKIFECWIRKAFPDKADKVLHAIAACHNGSLNDSRFGARIKGSGVEAEAIKQLYKIAVKKYMQGRSFPPYNYSAFECPDERQLSLF